MKKPFLTEAGTTIDASKVVVVRRSRTNDSAWIARSIGGWTFTLTEAARERILRELHPRMIEMDDGVSVNREHVSGLYIFSPTADDRPWVVRALGVLGETYDAKCQDEATARRLFASFHPSP
jgi:hypothetical protein